MIRPRKKVMIHSQWNYSAMWTKESGVWKIKSQLFVLYLKLKTMPFCSCIINCFVVKDLKIPSIVCFVYQISVLTTHQLQNR
jgi:hypothetical protein